MSAGTVPFGQWLKQRRKTLDLTREDLAMRVDCSLSSIEKIESGERRPSRQVADLLAECLGIPADEREAFVRFARTEPAAGEREQAEAPAEKAPWRAARRSLTNLPVPLTSLIGRDGEMAAVKSLLMRERVRLLTLTGPPGIGKTRLALEAASDIAGEFEDGVYFVPLASVSDPGLVLPAVARALRVHETAGQSLAKSLAEHLGDKRALLVLDNFEHLMPSAARVADLLTVCPWLKVLATSREPLQVRGGRHFAVPPLDVPDLESLPGAAALTGCASVALFVERAQENDPSFELTPENASIVAALCARLDGLPLAIELVAARRNALSSEVLLSGADNSLALRTELQDVPARHQTLRDATEWSYNLLDTGEQKLLARLGVFMGGCTRSAAEAVCNARGELPLKVSKGLASLSNKSLLIEQPPVASDAQSPAADEPRYTLLQTIHEYAVERLRESGEEAAFRRLHAEHYLALAEAAESEMEGPQQLVLMDWLENEHDNLRAALEWALTSGEVGIALHLSGALGQFWTARGYLSEGRGWLEAALSGSSDDHTPQRAKALVAAGVFAARQGDYSQAYIFYEEGLAIYRARGDKRGMAQALGKLGAAANDQVDIERADGYYKESLALFREIDDRAGIAGILNNLGNQEIMRGNVDKAAALYESSLQMAREIGNRQKVTIALLNLGRLALYQQHDYERALSYLEESLRLYNELGNRGGVAATLYQLGRAMLLMGSYSRAQAYFEEGLRLCEQLSEKPGIASTRLGIGLSMLLQGGHRQARELLSESLTLYNELGLKFGIIECLEALGGVTSLEGNAENATRLLGAAEALRETAGLQMPAIPSEPLDLWVEQARAGLGDNHFREAWQAGRGMSIDEATQLALGSGEPVPS